MNKGSEWRTLARTHRKLRLLHMCHRSLKKFQPMGGARTLSVCVVTCRCFAKTVRLRRRKGRVELDKGWAVRHTGYDHPSASQLCCMSWDTGKGRGATGAGVGDCVTTGTVTDSAQVMRSAELMWLRPWGGLPIMLWTPYEYTMGVSITRRLLSSACRDTITVHTSIR